MSERFHTHSNLAAVAMPVETAAPRADGKTIGNGGSTTSDFAAIFVEGIQIAGLSAETPVPATGDPAMSVEQSEVTVTQEEPATGASDTRTSDQDNAQALDALDPTAAGPVPIGRSEGFRLPLILEEENEPEEPRVFGTSDEGAILPFEDVVTDAGPALQSEPSAGEESALTDVNLISEDLIIPPVVLAILAGGPTPPAVTETETA